MEVTPVPSFADNLREKTRKALDNIPGEILIGRFGQNLSKLLEGAAEEGKGYISLNIYRLGEMTDLKAHKKFISDHHWFFLDALRRFLRDRGFTVKESLLGYMTISWRHEDNINFF